MNKNIPFKKEIIFKTSLNEITSISLEHTLKIEDNILSGNFIISGNYKITENSVDVEEFMYELPFEVAFDSKYNLDKSQVDIDDFYYEIINNSVLSVNIDVLVTCIEENIKEDNMEIIDEVEEQRCVEEEVSENKDINISLFNNIDINDTYKTYKVHIIRENDTLESIMEKYNVTKDILIPYNDLAEIKIGNKLVIPVENEGD